MSREWHPVVYLILALWKWDLGHAKSLEFRIVVNAQDGHVDRRIEDQAAGFRTQAARAGVAQDGVGTETSSIFDLRYEIGNVIGELKSLSKS